MDSDSATGTLNSMPRRDRLPTHEDVTMYGGYEYFGSGFLKVLANSSIPSCTIARSFGAERKRMPRSSMFVKNEVDTDAPFS